MKLQLFPLTSIRLFLALWVVVYHLAWPAGSQVGWWSNLPTWCFLSSRAAITVLDLFFISSGFILAYHYQLNRRWTHDEIGKYAVARFGRLVPVYFLSLLLIAPFEIHRYMFHATVRAAGAWARALATWTLLQSWTPLTAMSWNGPAWSLSVDAFFYVLFPIVGVVIWRLSSIRSAVLFSALLWGLALTPPLVAIAAHARGFGTVSGAAYLEESAVYDYRASVVPPRNVVLPAAPISVLWANTVKYNPLLRFPDFLCGIVLCRIFRKLIDSKAWLVGRGSVLYLPGLVGLLLTISLLTDKIPFPLLHNGILMPFYCSIVLGLALGGGLLVRILSLRPLVFLGSASYSIYLLHIPILLWAVRLRLFGLRRFEGAGSSIIGVLLVTVVSCLVLKFYEEPMNRLIRNTFSRRFAGGAEKRQHTASAALAAG